MLQAGVARTDLTPYWGVELTGWGYYMERRWRRIHDPLSATALVAEADGQVAVVIALDLMVIDAAFAERTRLLIHDATGIAPSAVMLTCSHSHKAPAAGGLLGVGACDPFYEEWASRQAATAAILAWNQREPALFRSAACDVPDLSFNRTRPNGVVDSQLTVLRVDRADGRPLAVVANFGAHPTVATELRPWDVSRDIPGVVCDGLEAAFPGATALYIQGACGDTNFHRDFMTADRWREPGERLVATATQLLNNASLAPSIVQADQRSAVLPTRRWQDDELLVGRREAERRLAAKDTSNWRETIGRSMTNRPDDMIRRHGGDEWKAVAAMCRFHIEWTDKMLTDYQTRPETLATEVQALRFGNLGIVANSSEFFSPFALDVRQRSSLPQVMMACYSNGRIGYLPDEHDINARSYAGYQSPKYCNQFPFTASSGPAMCEAMVASLRAVSEFPGAP
ncbi:MAG TPA: hypothetical protein VFG20_08020 [Planctomycetaceae bacterium]|nr:hypothetical protein [Planctomycetaceae bacterium]